MLSGERRRYLCWKGGSHAIKTGTHDAFDFPVQSRQSIGAEMEVIGMVEGIGSASTTKLGKQTELVLAARCKYTKYH